MGDAVFDKLAEAAEDLEQVFHGHFLGEPACLWEVGSECPTLCKLEHDVEVVDSLVYIEEPDDVGALQLFIDLYFWVEGAFIVLVLEYFIFIDDFHCDLSLGVFLDAQVDGGEGPLSEGIILEDYVLPYPLLLITHRSTILYPN